MSDTKISQLPAGAPAQGADQVPAARAGANVKLLVSDITALAPVQSVAGKTGAVALAEGDISNLVADLAAKVPVTTTVNSHPLSANVVISASDLTTGTLPHAQLPTLVSSDIPNNAANTSGTAANVSGAPALPNGTSVTTQAALDNSTKAASTAYADAAVAVETSARVAALAGKQNVINFADAEPPSGQGAGNTVLTIAHAPVTVASLRVYRNGVLLTLNDASGYTLSGVTLTLAVAMSSTDSVIVYYRY